MNRLKKSFLLMLLIVTGTSPLIHAQEKKSARPLISQEQKWIAIHTLEVSVGLLMLYLFNIYFPNQPVPLSRLAQRDPEFAAMEARKPKTGIITTGLFFTLHGLVNLYQELDISGQIKKLIKLLKKEEKEKKNS